MCPICPYTNPPCNTVKSQITGYIHNITQPLDCNSENVIYYWRCKKANCKQYPECEYLGLTTKSFKKRFSNHIQYVKSNMTDQPSGEHFNSPGHNLTHLEGLAIECVKNADPFVLRAREWRLIRLFDTFRHGLNKEP